MYGKSKLKIELPQIEFKTITHGDNLTITKKQFTIEHERNDDN